MQRLTNSNGRTSRSLLFALAALALALLSSACGTAECQSLKASGSFFGDLLCGGEGDPAPQAADGGPNACSDISQVMPEFFELLDGGQLTGIQQAVEQIGQPTCADSDSTRHCDSDTLCAVGVCDTTSSLCPCANVYNPLGDLLETLFSGIAAIADPNSASEPGAVAPSKCVDAVDAENLLPSQRNPLCEIRRTLDFLLNQNGGNELLNNPQVTQVLLSLLNYVQGSYPASPTDPTPSPHYDLFTTFGLMAQNPGVCDPQTTYDLLDNLFGYLTPPVAQRLLGDLNTLLDDPTTESLLVTLGGGTVTNPAARRQAVVTLLLTFLPGIQSSTSGAAALSEVEPLVVSLVYKSSSYNDAFKSKVRIVLSDLGCADPDNSGTCSVPTDPVMGGGVLGPAAGIFNDITNPSQQSGLLWCLAAVDPTGNLVGALYDLVTITGDSASGISIPTLLGALQQLVSLDSTGQLTRTLRFVVESIAADDTATEALRELLAQALTPAVGQELIPPLAALVQHQVIGEILNLLQDLLYSCSPPANTADAGSP